MLARATGAGARARAKYELALTVIQGSQTLNLTLCDAEQRTILLQIGKVKRSK